MASTVPSLLALDWSLRACCRLRQWMVDTSVLCLIILGLVTTLGLELVSVGSW